MIKILYVEDEVNLAQIVKDTLVSSGYMVRLVSDGSKVLNETKEFRPDICLMDVMLPNIDGFTLGKQINKEMPHIPIIFLTAKNQPKDVLTGFRSGGNDYIKKPFSMEELMVRIDNIIALRSGKGQKKTNDIVHIGKFVFDPMKHTLSMDGSSNQLSYREVEVLTYCSLHINGQISKKDMLLKIWGDDNFYNSRNLDVYIRKLRSYLDLDPKISLLTLRGVGYKFTIEE